jgi:biopolymer transport protein TolQ
MIGSALIFDAYAHSDIFGKLIFLALFTISILSWVLLVYKIWFMYTTKKLSNEFYALFHHNKEALFSLDTLPIPTHKEVPNSFFELYYTLKLQTLEILNKNKISLQESDKVYLSSPDIEFIETQLYTKASAHKKSLEKYLFVLSTVVTLAPFLGLLGTVWGILVTFGDLNSIGANNNIALSGLSMALATTVLGLVVAIPALISYNYLKNNINDFVTDMEHFSHELIALVEKLYRKVEMK